MALTATQVQQALAILFPRPSEVHADTGSGNAGWLETEARVVLGSITAAQETLVATILTAWAEAWLDASAIDATARNAGYRIDQAERRELLRQQLVAVLQYDPTPTRQAGGMIGRA